MAEKPVLYTHECKVERFNFWKASSVHIERPHLINKRSCGTKLLWNGAIHKISTSQIYNSIYDFLSSIKERNEMSDDDLVAILLEKFKDGSLTFQNHLKSELFFCDTIKDGKEKSNDFNINDLPCSLESFLQNPEWKIVVFRKILPKNIEHYSPAIEFLVLDFDIDSIGFITHEWSEKSYLLPCFNYSIELINENISLCILENESFINFKSDDKEADTNYIRNVVIKKIYNWSKNIDDKGSETNTSLRHVDVAKYNQLYNELKEKYGKTLIQSWTETTDPLKFVYEDIGIATYIILIWEKETKARKLQKKQSFVDLGCGNGLLVYILTQEGYSGLGLDIRRRKIWDNYPPEVKLEERTFEPSDKHLLPEYDWLIGNHSDELTPWIPVVAAKSSYNCSFLVIPCCPHDFTNKYLRQQSNLSQYSEYLEYVQEIGEVCGFKVCRDRLKIPSTKRACFFAFERDFRVEDTAKIHTRIDNFIKEKSSRYKVAKNNNSSSDNWTVDFRPRIDDNRVRNCTILPPESKEEIVNIAAKFILRKKHFISVIGENEEEVSFDIGGMTELGQIIKELNREQIELMKKECGGLQTLLRNHCNVFDVRKGVVCLKVPKSIKDVKQTANFKTKSCWFYFNHPQKCIWSDHNCSYSHELTSVESNKT